MAGDSQVGSPELLERLLSMRIEEPGATLSFEDALARENNWPLERAVAVSLEYRRFLYLAATAGRPVTPSAAVDRAWHLHLTYSRHYWDILCGLILGLPLHHLPSAGGEAEVQRHARQYEDTLAIYEAIFGSPPAPSVWPRPRAGSDPRRGRVDQRLGIVFFAVAAAIIGGFSYGVVGFLLAVAALTLVVAVVLSTEAKAQKRRGGGGSCGGGGGGECVDGGCGAGCGGGCGGGCG